LELLEDNLNNYMWYHRDSKLVEKYIMKKYAKFYTKFWEIFPDEKIAEADSSKILLDSINQYENFKLTNKKEYYFILNYYLNSLLNGYIFIKKENRYNVPLKDYLNAVYAIDILEKTDSTIKEEINNLNNYTLEQRLKYGFPITKEDVKEVKQKILTKNTI